MPEESISGLMGRIGSKSLELDPDFQRNFIWTPKTQKLFIDSILRGYKIPPIWIWRREDEDGEEIESVIDGQQRLQTLWNFTQNKFSFTAPKKIVVPNTEVDGLSDIFFDKGPIGKDDEVLPDNLRKEFKRFKLDYIVVEEDDIIVIRDIFNRLNTTFNKLTPQEIRNAFYFGEFKKYIYQKTATIRSQGSGGIKWWSKGERAFKRDTRDRMGVQQFLSEIIVALDKGSVQHRTNHVDEYYESFETGFQTRQKKLDKRLDRILLTLRNAFLGSQSRMTKNKSELYSLIMLIDSFDRDPRLKKKGLKVFNEGNANRIGDALKFFRNAYIQYHDDIRAGKKKVGDIRIFDKYYDTIVKEIHQLATRQDRHKILSRVIEPALAELDTKRLFSIDQKELIWDISDNKTCHICSQTVSSFDDYEPDHVKPHAKQGATCISNGRISHRECNRKKGYSKNDTDKQYEYLFKWGSTDLMAEPLE